jgi:hypothetical protein
VPGTEDEQDFFNKLKAHIDSVHVQHATKANRLIDLVEDLFSRSWIYCRHLALILECFAQFGYYRQTKFFGTFRSELAVILYGRVIDLFHFDSVVRKELECFRLFFSFPFFLLLVAVRSFLLLSL